MISNRTLAPRTHAVPSSLSRPARPAPPARSVDRRINGAQYSAPRYPVPFPAIKIRKQLRVNDLSHLLIFVTKPTSSTIHSTYLHRSQGGRGITIFPEPRPSGSKGHTPSHEGTPFPFPFSLFPFPCPPATPPLLPLPHFPSWDLFYPIFSVARAHSTSSPSTVCTTIPSRKGEGGGGSKSAQSAKSVDHSFAFKL